MSDEINKYGIEELYGEESAPDEEENELWEHDEFEDDDENEDYDPSLEFYEEQEEEAKSKSKKKGLRKKKDKQEKGKKVSGSQKKILLGSCVCFVVLSAGYLGVTYFTSSSPAPVAQNQMALQNNQGSLNDKQTVNPITNKPITNKTEANERLQLALEKSKQQKETPKQTVGVKKETVQPKTVAFAKKQNEKIEKSFEKLTQKIDSMNNKIDSMQKSMVSYFDKSNNAFDALNAKLDNLDMNSADSTKIVKLKQDNSELKEKVSTLQKAKEKVQGKYDWVRHLNNEKKVKIEKLEQKLSKVESQVEDRPVYPGWSVVGMSEEMVVLMSDDNRQVKKLAVGDTMYGTTIEKISIDTGKVFTSSGILSYNTHY